MSWKLNPPWCLRRTRDENCKHLGENVWKKINESF